MLSLRKRYSLATICTCLTVLFLVASVFKVKEQHQLFKATVTQENTNRQFHPRQYLSQWYAASDDAKSTNNSLRETVQSLLGQNLDDETLRQLLMKSIGQASTAPPITEDPKLLIDRRVADSISKKVRVLCWIPSRQIFWDTRLKAVNETWVKRCDKVIYFMTSPNKASYDVVGVKIRDSRQTLTEKTVFAHTYIFNRYLDEFDWFLKADDDTYVIMENLKFLLTHFDAKVPGYIGCQFRHFSPQGYMSGGAGYLFNREGLRRLVRNGYAIPGRCRLEGGAEDIETGRCAYKAGVRTLNQVDKYKRETFLPANAYGTVVGPIPDWARGYMRTSKSMGKECCSQLLVSFHYTGTKLMYLVDFLLYRVNVHGRRFMEEKADSLFDGQDAKDMELTDRRRPYPGETLQEYYDKT